jgi:Ca2+/Na+ antiporter
MIFMKISLFILTIILSTFTLWAQAKKDHKKINLKLLALALTGGTIIVFGFIPLMEGTHDTWIYKILTYLFYLVIPITLALFVKFKPNANILKNEEKALTGLLVLFVLVLSLSITGCGCARDPQPNEQTTQSDGEFHPQTGGGFIPTSETEDKKPQQSPQVQQQQKSPQQQPQKDDGKFHPKLGGGFTPASERDE